MTVGRGHVGKALVRPHKGALRRDDAKIDSDCILVELKEYGEQRTMMFLFQLTGLALYTVNQPCPSGLSNT